MLMYIICRYIYLDMNYSYNSLFPLPLYWYQILKIIYLYVWRDERSKTTDMMRDTFCSG